MAASAPSARTVSTSAARNAAHFDQQPLEANSMVAACLEAYRVTRDASWARQARLVFEWFLGRNDLGVPLHDALTGGCRDDLHTNRVNQNQGAESTLAYLMSLTEMRLAAASGIRLAAPLEAVGNCAGTAA